MEKDSLEKHEQHLRQLLDDLGEDASREGLDKTPRRYLKALRFLTSGYRDDVEKLIKGALFDVPHRDMVIVRDIEFYSLCEHHMLPFYGRCHVGYIPSEKVIGLSKIPRVVDIYARRLQVQERMTNEIAEAIETHLRPLGVGVIVEAFHMCMMMRGVEKHNSFSMTSSMRGSFQSMETRSEFLNLIRGPRL